MRPVLVEQNMVAGQVPCQFLMKMRNSTWQTGPSYATEPFRIVQEVLRLRALKALLGVTRGDHALRKKEAVSRRLVD